MICQEIARGGETVLFAIMLALAGCDRAETPGAPPILAQSGDSIAAEAGAGGETETETGSETGADTGTEAAADTMAVVSNVRVANIGMHIGGGPNDDVTKEPIARSVAPHFEEFKSCFALLESPLKVELGVDLLIEAAGGKAKVTNPRSTAPPTMGTGFRDCGVRVFEAIEFEKPKTGKTIVSYSLQFTPQKTKI